MKLNTHSPTPHPENKHHIKGLFILSAILIYSLFGLAAFACFYYAHSITGGVFVIAVPVLLTAMILILVRDIERAYVEIKEHEIYIVDYCFGIRKEKRFSLSDITSAEICLGNSLKVKGYRLTAAGTQYIVFRKGKKYLFKIIYLPETVQLFKQYINNQAESEYRYCAYLDDYIDAGLCYDLQMITGACIKASALSETKIDKEKCAECCSRCKYSL